MCLFLFPFFVKAACDGAFLTIRIIRGVLKFCGKATRGDIRLVLNGMLGHLVQDGLTRRESTSGFRR